MTKIVAIIGRTNVGKSTLFNRLLKKRFAITSYTPQTTRDRLYSEVTWRGKEFVLVDTAGLNLDAKDEFKDSSKKIEHDIYNQAQEAVNEADLLVFTVDSKDGITDYDKEIADIIRKSKKEALVAVNKVDNQEMEKRVSEFEALGLGKVVSVSAISGRKSGDLLDEIVAKLDRVEPQNNIRKADVNIGIVGRPNVGKSTLINQLSGRNRVLVSDVPGTTIDTVDVFIEHNGKRLRLIDTAGIRRRGKIKTGIEKFSVLRAIKAISRADLVILLIDAKEGVTKQDMHIAQFILEAGRGLILAVNKWDLLEEESTIDRFLNSLRSRVRFLPWSPVVFISALKGKNVKKLLDLVEIVSDNRKYKIPTRRLNEIVAQATNENPPRAKSKKQPKIYFSSQVSVDPPFFAIKVNDPSLFHFSYLRFIERSIRQEFDFTGTPIKIELRSSKSETRPDNKKV